MTKILMKTNQLCLGIVLTQKVENDYLIAFVTSSKKHFLSKKSNLIPYGVFWSD